MFFSYFNNYLKVLKLDMNRFEWTDPITIIFVICFSLGLD
jgi:hypothetical protein